MGTLSDFEMYGLFPYLKFDSICILSKILVRMYIKNMAIICLQ